MTKSDEGRDEKGRFATGHHLSFKGHRGQPGNKHRHVHGGAAAVQKLGRGEPFPENSLARSAELAVYDELQADGRQSLVVRNAARLQAATDLYWNAVEKAAQDGDLKMLDSYVKRFGWLASATLRAWAQVRREESEADKDTLDYNELVKELQADGED